MVAAFGTLGRRFKPPLHQTPASAYAALSFPPTAVSFDADTIAHYTTTIHIDQMLWSRRSHDHGRRGEKAARDMIANSEGFQGARGAPRKRLPWEPILVPFLRLLNKPAPWPSSFLLFNGPSPLCLPVL